ncbi:uncharacterized protein LODBEIA_P56310 [Lodderomyces beijingensis]|uniref:Glutathione reductase n=1 Tax=Lodderomyces beijingensis TaxID=1775926 RepID=A0ABP0ZVB9_9ASCO
MAPIASSLKNFDYLVIGGGSGGVASARRAAKYGAKVLLIESNFNKLGGTCVNVGCVPKKVMWYASDLAHKKADLFDYKLDETREPIKYGEFNWGEFKVKRDAYVTRLNGIYANNLKKEGVDYLFGFGKFINSQGDVEVKLSGDQEIPWLESGKQYKKGETLVFSADKVLIATGGTAIIPPDTPGADLGITSNGFFDLERQPKRVAIVGAGYIGVEFSGVFNGLGTQVDFIIRRDTVLRAFDDIIQNTITDHYIDNLGVNIIKNSGVKKIETAKDDPSKKIVTLINDDTLVVDDVIWTVGRKSLVDLGLEHVGVKLNERGQVEANEYQATANPKIFSLGDVVGKVELTPVAIAAGRKLSNRLFGGPEFKDAHLDYNYIPSAVFSHPECGSIGLSTQEAIAKYGKDNVKVYNSKFTAMYYAMVENPKHKSPTVYRIVTQGPDEKVVGLHLVGDGSAEILQGFGVAIKMGATKADFDNCVAIHPSSAEELVTMT